MVVTGHTGETGTQQGGDMDLRRVISCSLAVSAAAAFAAVPASASAQGGPPPRWQPNRSQFRGVNWADPRDNYAADAVVPSGLSTRDSYLTTYRKASGIVREFRREL